MKNFGGNGFILYFPCGDDITGILNHQNISTKSVYILYINYTSIKFKNKKSNHTKIRFHNLSDITILNF